MLPTSRQRRKAADNREETNDEEEQARLEGSKRRTLALSVDRCEDQGAE
jgi:hypothetical protein